MLQLLNGIVFTNRQRPEIRSMNNFWKVLLTQGWVKQWKFLKTARGKYFSCAVRIRCGWGNLSFRTLFSVFLKLLQNVYTVWSEYLCSLELRWFLASPSLGSEEAHLVSFLFQIHMSDCIFLNFMNDSNFTFWILLLINLNNHLV